MPESTQQRVRTLKLLKEHGTLRQRDFSAEGIGSETLARLVRDAAIIRAARGLYQLPVPQTHAAHTLAEAATLVPRGVICLVSALQFHELTLQLPSAVWMAIERTAWRPKIVYPQMHFVRSSKTGLVEGIKRHLIDGVRVPITNPARTIVDCFRYRNKIGLDVALEALRDGLRKRRFAPKNLYQFASEFRIWTVMQPYVEAMVTQ